MTVNRLTNKNILLIGGTSGIGFAVAKQALASGANITISSSSKERVSQAVQDLQASNPARASSIRSQVTDLSIRENLENTIESLLKFSAEISPIDHVVFTAGNVPPLVSLPEASFDDVEAFLTVRFFGAMAVAKYAPRYMNPSKSSSITLTSGSQSQKPTAWLPPAICGAIEGLMKGLAVTLSPIRVNVVSPGFVLTGLIDRLPEEMRNGLIEKSMKQSLTKDIGYPEDAAEAYLYLMKDHFVTGATIATNGGVFLV
ncbi:uncharacterized protein N7483_009371 [Penicillium malachiteum]|uniref:uncharacterized protein n=1 Tax=Penicillium malachiteum TaxID=1324776 RepID=UPI002548F17C|nr:uncharacterized protein N7483_009371 [Penicillium malachiteum]KAJ5721437.1 hypothetical protein N7483_009371 [Penicillium malachiteum]